MLSFGMSAVSSLNEMPLFSPQKYGMFHSRNVFYILVLNLQPMDQGWTRYEANPETIYIYIYRKTDIDVNEMLLIICYRY
jgi:hypothetical protein